MWLLSTEHLELRCFNSPKEVAEAHPCTSASGTKFKPGYAILSHVWDDTEQSFTEIQQLQLRDGVTSYADHRVSKKVRECVRVAKEQGFAWVWDDTWCINKCSSAELEEAINSMFRWYAEAEVCFAYLRDVPDDCFPGEPGAVSEPFRNSIWFKRGWTLQELLAPRYLVFFSKEWKYLGTRAMLADVVQEITGIDVNVLTSRRPLQHVPVATRMSWAANRQTKRVEDQAYSLLGIFQVSMSTIYGEGSYAFQRLQAKIMKRHADHTLFAWGRTWEPVAKEAEPLGSRGIDPEFSRANPVMAGSPFDRLPSPARARSSYPPFTPPSFEQSSIFASHPSDFRQYNTTSGAIPITQDDAALSKVQEFVEVQTGLDSTAVVYEHAVTSSGVRCNFIIIEGTPFSLALLLCKDNANNCLALPLWPQRDNRSSTRPFRVGVSFPGVSEGYRHFQMSLETLAALRRRGWMPLPAECNVRGDVDSDPFTVPPASLTSLSRRTLVATIKTIYINNLHPFTVSHRLRELRQEPSEVFISPWTPDYLARYNLRLQGKSRYCAGAASEVPLTLYIRHQAHPAKTEFTVHFDQCGGKLFAEVEFTAEHHPFGDIPLRRHEQQPNCCYASGSAHEHINVWPNGARSFFDDNRVVQLTATHWPATDSYCFDIRLGGIYTSTRKFQSPSEDASRSSIQAELVPSPLLRPQDTGLTGKSLQPSDDLPAVHLEPELQDNGSSSGETEPHYEWMESMHGVTVDQISGYMSSIWLKSAMLARGSMPNDSTDWRPRCLAEFTRSEGDIHFRMQLGAPMVKILCEREIVIWFDIDELEFFEDGDFTSAPERRFSGWKVAMVVNAIYNRDAACHTVTIVFDLSNARYHKALSSYPGLDETDDITLDYYDLIVAFFSGEYLQILLTAHYHILYSDDTRQEPLPKMRFGSQDDSDEEDSGEEDSDGEPELDNSSSVSSRQTIRRTKMFGFDQVTAVSQASLNAQFSASTYAAFHSWAFENYFSASYKPLSLRLLSNNRALVCVHLANGSLKALKDWALWDGSEQYISSDWRLDFEVDLKMCSQSELEGMTSTTYTSSQQFLKHGHSVDRELRHIYLDFQNAEYVHESSNFGDIKNMGGDSRSLILKLQAAVFYLTQYYFPALCKDGMNIITSIPVWKEGHRSLPSYALTDVTFHVYSKVEITRHNWTQVTPGQEPIIVVLGTTGGRPLPSPELEFSTGWIVHANRGFSHGTIGISRRVFIEERLLTLLSNVNSYTTMIPVLLDPSQGFHGLGLKKWSEHDQHKDRPSKWELLPSDGEGCLKYLWEHCEESRYNLCGNSDTQGVSCVTRNYVEIPTAAIQGALHIKISGKVELTLTLQAGRSDCQTASSSVSWSAIVTVETCSRGRRFRTLGSHGPVFVKGLTPENSERFRSPMDMLREAFPDKVNLNELGQEIRAFEGPWQYCYPLTSPYSLASPVFNEDGDLLFELRQPYTVHSRGRIHAASALGIRVPRRDFPLNGYHSAPPVGRQMLPAPRPPTALTRAPGKTECIAPPHGAAVGHLRICLLTIRPLLLIPDLAVYSLARFAYLGTSTTS